MVAVGTVYGQVGDKFDLRLESGQFLRVIIGDSKGGRCAHDDGSMLEFIVDTNVMDSEDRLRGNLERIYGGRIVNIWRYLED